MNNYIREPINGLTHLAGAVLAFVGLLAMVIKAAATTSSPSAITAVIIFGVSMILLYSASATYHMVIAHDQVIAFLRRLDHSMIFILIAGTYTPFCFISLNGKIGAILFSIIAGIAISGVVFKMVWFNCPRWISTSLYLAMGWMIVFVFSPLTGSLNPIGLFLLILGGIFYTIGGIIYGAKPKFLQSKYMGFHEIFHIFILLGSLAHFLTVFLYVI
ncbi:hemolysin III family protein [Bacillus sp. ISL-40]|uniref:PAQR family membrane homeostasis protein TrhA n=1 Tax=unclassified Bacillus (in: firmicutes) TaxID=185979 RepID=UPI001BE98EF6|nr:MULTISPECIES: hemolysin III family protein [unclassified Bacillus (in: firmicutes)]MBT2697387.1 hemolysin III family protein [Bacillus sp. ISL-40]MBT2723887.1 hemolysin III family protein [Bacillus sp. ISL-46]MBT2741795.1 hemolysin III family protein [Bacillus sp. ISL-77]